MGDEANVCRKEERQGEGKGQGPGNLEQYGGAEDHRLSRYAMGWRKRESFCLVGLVILGYLTQG